MAFKMITDNDDNYFNLSEEVGNKLFKEIESNNMNLHGKNKNGIGYNNECFDIKNNGKELVMMTSNYDNLDTANVGGSMCDGCEKMLSFFNNRTVLFEIDKYHCDVCNCTDLCTDCYSENIQPIHGPNDQMCNGQCKYTLVKTRYPHINKEPTF